MKKITVLGAGLVGSAIVLDLAAEDDFTVTAIDRNDAALAALGNRTGIVCREADLSQAEGVASAVEDADLVVSAVPGFMGYRTLEAVIRARKPVVDISFFPENALDLDVDAKNTGVTAVVDCGVAPGLCNVIAGALYRRWDRIERYECFVGGLPENPEPPFNYRAVFSPIDVLEEYTRPARFVENGETVVRDALSDVEPIDLPGVATLEAFNTDGLRSLIHTLDIPFMKEKTLRYPGHADLMRTFRDSGFFQTGELEIDGSRVRPLDVTASLLFDEWKMKPGERDLTVMRVVLEGERAGERLRATYDLLDRADEETGVHSMARTTGYTATVVARIVLAGGYVRPGISPPEYLGFEAGLLEKLREGLEARNIVIRENIVPMDS